MIAAAGSVDPKVLVLLAAHNGAAWIGEQLRSILGQARAHVRVIVSDDSSTDSTQAELARLTDARVTVVRRDRPSGSAARNFFSLIRDNACDGFDLVAFSDQDDIWHEDKLARAAELLRQSGCAGYSSAVLAFWDNGREQVLRQVERITLGDFLFEGAGQGCTFVLTPLLYERMRNFVIARTDLTVELQYHDWAVYALARIWGMRWAFDASPSLRYRQHDGNHTGARYSFTGVARRLAHIANGWYRAQIGAATRLCIAAAGAQSSSTLQAWQAAFSAPDSYNRRLRIARFCLRGGRRRRLDNMILIAAALAGRI
jgi:rhamnosyltransferase